MAGMLAMMAAPPQISREGNEEASTPEEMSVADIYESRRDSIAAALDSIKRVKAEKLADEASEQYKKVKFMLYEGELESNLYPEVLASNKIAMELLDSAYDNTQRQRARDILLDLNPMMENAAIFYSGKGDSENLTKSARAYIDTQLRPEFQDAEFKRNERLYPQLAYMAAFGATQARDTESAKRYFECYLASDAMDQRENVTIYYGQACLETHDYVKGFEALNTGVLRCPTNMQILTLALQTCLDGGLTDRMQPLLDKAIALDPHNEKLLKLQAQLYERNQDFTSALDIYNRLREDHPESLEIVQSVARCYYNLGASHYNASIMEDDDKIASRHRRQSRSYFQSAATALGHVLANTPSDMKYLTAQAHTYAAMGEKEKFDEINRSISGFGGTPVKWNAMPPMMAGGKEGASGNIAAVKVPTYEQFAAPYIAKHIAEWAKRGEFEPMEDYEKRVHGDTETIYNELNARAEEEYLKTYARQLIISDLKRYDYDMDNQVYRIDTPYGSTYVKVPSRKHEAEAFKAGWDMAQIRAPKFIIKDNKVAIGGITYVVNGRKYTYDAEDMANYTTPYVYVDINSIINKGKGSEGNDASGGGTLIGKKSDVDENIPVTGRKSKDLFALIISNQNYQKASDVNGALNDGSAMREYCIKTLGALENQVTLINNATGNQVRDALATLARRVKGNGPQSEVIFFYAGHGLPNDAGTESYMMPVDANPLEMITMIPMKEIYGTLGKMEAESVSVLLDACFSGMGRDGGAMKKGERGVEIAAKAAEPEGNMFVLTAASGAETAMPYEEKNHGLFTYFLLKKLQESKGNATLKELSDYVISTVQRESDVLNSKPQHPVVSVSGKLSQTWTKKKLKP